MVRIEFRCYSKRFQRDQFTSTPYFGPVIHYRGSTGVFLLLRISVRNSAPMDLVAQLTEHVSSFLIHHGGYYDFSVLDDPLTSKRFTRRNEQLTKCCEPLQKMRVRL